MTPPPREPASRPPGHERPQRGLLDTSVFIAAESGRPLDTAQLPAETAISVVTLAELRAGVLAAGDVFTRGRRLSTLEVVSDLEVLPIDEAAVATWAEMRVYLAEAGRRIDVNDLWIAASAASRGIPVVSQDDDFAALQGFPRFLLIRV